MQRRTSTHNSMCGILGSVSSNAESVGSSNAVFASALDLIAHRGPDDAGTWWSQDRRVALGHRRLSIIDLSSAGHQPMTNEDGTIQIVYNGEVYNFEEIRTDLIARGHVFRSHTDTEVIVHGYEEYGPDIVRRLRGMFAFALYDVSRRRTVIARDRVGIKPLYYVNAGGALSFASEIKSLLRLADVPRELDVDSLREYLALGKVMTPNTMFRTIKKLPAGHYMIVGDDGSQTITSYWTPYEQSIDAPADAGEAYYVERLRLLLEESVQLRMVSDVPVGVFLSGGVDSTANLAMMTRASSEPVRTFTCGFRGEQAYDERDVARRAAEHYGSHHSEIEITREDIVKHLPELTWYLDEPVSDPTVIPIYFLSKFARREGAVVILNGDGSDEMLCGYTKYLNYLRVHPYWSVVNRLPVGVRRAAHHIGQRFGVNGVPGELLARAASGDELYVGGTTALKSVRGFRDVVSGGARSVYASVRAERARFDAMRAGDDYAEWLSYWGLRSELEPVFLYRADRMGMANSIEIRLPFLDHKLVELAMQMPQELKYRNGTAKYILKKALEPIVPHEFLYRRKQGFCVPIREWAGSMMIETIRGTLPEIAAHLGDSGRWMLDLVDDSLAGDGDAGTGGVAWELYTLCTWYRKWFGVDAVRG